MPDKWDQYIESSQDRWSQYEEESNEPNKTIPQKIASRVAPYMPIAGATAGGILAAPANIVAPGIAEAVGVGGGFLIGSEVERRLKEFAG